MQKKYYEIVGHVIRFRPEEFTDLVAWRHRLGYGEEPLIVCSVGGTSVGQRLLELCGQAFLPLRTYLPNAHMVLVFGPRLSIGSFQVPSEIEVRGHIPRLYELYACCDVAVVQCGASSTTELSALRRPFIYFPIEGHFEQELVANLLVRYGIGRRMSLKKATPESLAEAIYQEYRCTVPYNLMLIDGATKAAQHVLLKLEHRYLS